MLTTPAIAVIAAALILCAAVAIAIKAFPNAAPPLRATLARAAELLKQARMIEWWLIAGVSFIAIALTHPQQVPVTLYKVSLVSLSAVLGFRLDRGIFPYSRPDLVEPQFRSGAELRRAIVIAAVIIGVTLGV